MFLSVEAEWAPAGIEIVDMGIKTRASSTVSVVFSEYTQPDNGGTETAVDAAIATSASTEAEDDGSLTNPGIAVGNIVMVEYDGSVTDQLQIWMTFYINDN